MAILYSEPAAWQAYKRNLPVGYKVISTKEALDPKNREILVAAREFINRNVSANKGIGTQEFRDVNGRKCLFIVEPHYHEPNGPVKPWGWHKGCTVFIPPADSFLFWSPGGEKELKPWAKYGAMAASAALFAIAPVLGGIVAGGLAGAELFEKFKKHQAEPPLNG